MIVSGNPPEYLLKEAAKLSDTTLLEQIAAKTHDYKLMHHFSQPEISDLIKVKAASNTSISRKTIGLLIKTASEKVLRSLAKKPQLRQSDMHLLFKKCMIHVKIGLEQIQR